MDFGESIHVGYLLRSGYIFSGLKVLIVSDSSWVWLLVSAQVDIGDISVCAASPRAEENLRCIRQEKLSLLDNCWISLLRK
jgi:hypothetical protein